LYWLVLNEAPPMSDHTQQPALRVLMVEDSADDAELILDTLTEGGFVVDCLRRKHIRALPYTNFP